MDREAMSPRFHYVPNVLAARQTFPVDQATRNSADMAHGVLMGISIILFFPAGGLIVRLSKSQYAFWLHIGCQMLGLAIMLAGFGTGIWTAVIHREVYTDPHTSFGTCIVAFFILQPFLGILHHLGYIKAKKTNLWTWIHIWFGRIIMILAVVDLGIGIQYAENAVAAEKGVGAVAGIFGVAYVCTLIWWYSRGVKGPRAEPKTDENVIEDQHVDREHAHGMKSIEAASENQQVDQKHDDSMKRKEATL